MKCFTLQQRVFGCPRDFQPYGIIWVNKFCFVTGTQSSYVRKYIIQESGSIITYRCFGIVIGKTTPEADDITVGRFIHQLDNQARAWLHIMSKVCPADEVEAWRGHKNLLV